MKPYSYDVFLSYSFKDREWAKTLTEKLRKLGLKVWHAESAIAPGQSWQEEIRRALRQSKFVVAIVAKGARPSPNVAVEIGAAYAMGKEIFAVVPTEQTDESVHILFQKERTIKRGPVESVARRLVEGFSRKSVLS